MKANEQQVGGDHYKSAIQHWDYVIANDIPYLEAQVIKYLTRWRKKNGFEDVLKAKHFLDKLIEVEQSEQHTTEHDARLGNYTHYLPIFKSGELTSCALVWEGRRMGTCEKTQVTCPVCKANLSDECDKAGDRNGNKHFWECNEYTKLMTCIFCGRTRLDRPDEQQDVNEYEACAERRNYQGDKK